MTSSKQMRCYLCGASNPATKDHLPPKGFFPDPKPANLITIPCCNSCNHSFSADDEAFRVFLSSAECLSPAGKWVQENKSFKGTLARSPKFRQCIASSMGTRLRDGQLVDTLSFPRKRAHQFLTRLTKGLLTKFYPSVDYSAFDFGTKLVERDEVLSLQLNQLRDVSTYDSIGDGVFQFRHYVKEQDGLGIWMYVFYDASLGQRQ